MIVHFIKGPGTRRPRGLAPVREYAVGELHPTAKLSDRQVTDIRLRVATGAPPAQVAADFNVSPGYVACLARREYRKRPGGFHRIALSDWWAPA